VEGQELSNFVAGVAQVLSKRNNPNVMVIVESEAGMEIYQTLQSFVWAFGILRLADEITSANQKRISAQCDIGHNLKRMEEDMIAGAEIMKGPKN
jgi:hypothetical protein